MKNQIDKLTDEEIRNLKHESKPYKLSDGDNLYLHIMPNGGKWWRFRYRFDGKEKSLALGTYPMTSIEDARRSREAAKELLSQGFDPSEIRKQEKALSKADRIEGKRLPHVRIGFDGRIEIWKGGNVLHLTWDESRFIASMLSNITR